MNQYQLERTLFPIGDFNKEQVRQIAEELGFVVADKPDSQKFALLPIIIMQALLVQG